MFSTLEPFNTHGVGGGVCWLSDVFSSPRVENRSPVQAGWRSGAMCRWSWRYGAVSRWHLSHLSLEQLQDHVNVGRHLRLQSADRKQRETDGVCQCMDIQVGRIVITNERERERKQWESAGNRDSVSRKPTTELKEADNYQNPVENITRWKRKVCVLWPVQLGLQQFKARLQIAWSLLCICTALVMMMEGAWCRQAPRSLCVLTLPVLGPAAVQPRDVQRLWYTYTVRENIYIYIEVKETKDKAL